MNQRFYQTPWVVSAEQAKLILEQGATILDSRNVLEWLVGHVPNAIHVSWKPFSQKRSPDKGKLLENSEVLEQKLRQIGVFNDRPVIVVGNPAHPCNFGEEGRIVWMLRTLGHQAAAFVDGGDTALTQVGFPITLDITQPMPGDFVVKRTNLWSIQRDELQVQLSTQGTSQTLTVIDTRSPREFAGATIFGEQRGGHIPGALHFYFKDLLDSKGYLLSSDKIILKFNTLGITRDTSIVTYCTGGIRSAFFIAVLADLGFTNVRNYAGSMWEWSAAIASSYPLQANL
ncbi:MAG: rhodanese-like domain-containing protein [Cyanobacteriota bacterium]|nr:rhodanese-like domain-containing protein [Cyanobacteriota bacterium]